MAPAREEFGTAHHVFAAELEVQPVPALHAEHRRSVDQDDALVVRPCGPFEIHPAAREKGGVGVCLGPAADGGLTGGGVHFDLQLPPDLKEKVFLVVEMVEQRALGDAGSLDNPGQAGAGIPLGGKQAARRREDGLARFGGLRRCAFRHAFAS